MKHFLLLLLVLVAAHFAWSFASKRERRTAKKSAVRHGIPLALIVLGLVVSLMVAFYFSSTKVL